MQGPQSALTNNNQRLSNLIGMPLVCWPSLPTWLMNGSLDEHIWSIQFEDPTKLRNTRKVVDFSVPIAPDRKLSDYDLWHDYVTSKLLLLCAAEEGRIGSSAVAAIFTRNYFQFVRWREAKGISRNRLVNRDVLDSLLDELRLKGISGLLPLEERWNSLRSAFDDGSTDPPVRQKGNHTYLDMTQVLLRLGVPSSLLLPPTLRRDIRLFAAQRGLKSPDGLQIFVASEAELTENRMASFLRPIDFLHRFRGRLQHDPIGCVPFDGKSVQTIAHSLTGRQASRTFTIPPLQACYVIDKALIWVLDYGPKLLELRDRVRAEVRARAGTHWRVHEAVIKEIIPKHSPSVGSQAKGSPWPLHPAYFQSSKSDRPSLRTALYEHLIAACIIVIAAFSARRRGEILSLREDAISEEEEEFILTCYIEKTIRDIDHIPVPASVAKAVAILTELSEDRRRRTGEPWIITFDEAIPVRLRIGSKDSAEVQRAGIIDIGRVLERFSAFVGTPPLEDGQIWAPQTHQFRRWFGVVYYHRFRFPQLVALAHFYRHFDPNTTLGYIRERAHGAYLRLNDVERARAKQEARQRLQEFEQAGKDFTSERLTNVALGKEKIHGAGGRFVEALLAEMIDTISPRLELVSDKQREETIVEAVANLTQTLRFEPNPLGHTYCKCSSSATDLAQAECLKKRKRYNAAEPVAPDMAFASEEACLSCGHGVRFSENHALLKAIKQRLEARTDDAGVPALAVERNRLELLGRALDNAGVLV